MTVEAGGLKPILCAHVIRAVDERLLDLLSSLGETEWELPTVVPGWRVREVASHLLDTALRRLSMSRDDCRVERVNIQSSEDVVRLVNRLNAEGVTVYRRLSPTVMRQMMRMACEQMADYCESLDPFAEAAIGVSWAGQMSSPVWFDTARELTERWHHQQQIRLATDRPGIMTPELYHPVLDTFLRGLPHTFRTVSAIEGTAVLVEIEGECGGLWRLVRGEERWSFSNQAPGKTTAARIRIPQEIAWRIFTKGMDFGTARAAVTITGDASLAEQALRLVAIVG